MEITCTECGAIITRRREYWEQTKAERRFGTLIDTALDDPVFGLNYKKWRTERFDFIRDTYLELMERHRKLQEQIYDLEKDTRTRVDKITATKQKMSEAVYERIVEDYEQWNKTQ